MEARIWKQFAMALMVVVVTTTAVGNVLYRLTDIEQPSMPGVALDTKAMMQFGIFPMMALMSGGAMLMVMIRGDLFPFSNGGQRMHTVKEE